ncbi:DNA-directed RNA polymerase II subunit RPB1-like isoform X1 [Trematomus bernacchii]|uniref:DNA-directed RNA polymerase II subunit RPB1-like isoform X1 n=1 Tax=Trematomus bernacchii TaxID=40690 RepID=UPI00146F8A76|nr:DNA-directed RNA polymerase II subunit RPB1-like isoform X1 [Trematomus bernacchii]
MALGPLFRVSWICLLLCDFTVGLPIAREYGYPYYEDPSYKQPGSGSAIPQLNAQRAPAVEGLINGGSTDWGQENPLEFPLNLNYPPIAPANSQQSPIQSPSTNGMPAYPAVVFTREAALEPAASSTSNVVKFPSVESWQPKPASSGSSLANQNINLGSRESGSRNIPHLVFEDVFQYPSENIDTSNTAGGYGQAAGQGTSTGSAPPPKGPSFPKNPSYQQPGSGSATPQLNAQRAPAVEGLINGGSTDWGQENLKNPLEFPLNLNYPPFAPVNSQQSPSTNGMPAYPAVVFTREAALEPAPSSTSNVVKFPSVESWQPKPASGGSSLANQNINLGSRESDSRNIPLVFKDFFQYPSENIDTSNTAGGYGQAAGQGTSTGSAPPPKGPSFPKNPSYQQPGSGSATPQLNAQRAPAVEGLINGGSTDWGQENLKNPLKFPLSPNYPPIAPANSQQSPSTNGMPAYPAVVFTREAALEPAPSSTSNVVKFPSVESWQPKPASGGSSLANQNIHIGSREIDSRNIPHLVFKDVFQYPSENIDTSNTAGGYGQAVGQGTSTGSAPPPKGPSFPKNPANERAQPAKQNYGNMLKPVSSPRKALAPQRVSEPFAQSYISQSRNSYQRAQYRQSNTSYSPRTKW